MVSKRKGRRREALAWTHSAKNSAWERNDSSVFATGKIKFVRKNVEKHS